MICDKIKNGKLTTMIDGILMLKITRITVQSMRIQVNKSIQGKFDEYALTEFLSPHELNQVGIE